MSIVSVMSRVYQFPHWATRGCRRIKQKPAAMFRCQLVAGVILGVIVAEVSECRVFQPIMADGNKADQDRKSVV